MKKTLLTLLGLAAFSLAGVHAQTPEVIAGFDFAGTTTDPQSFSTLNADLSGSGLSRIGLGASSSSQNFGSNGWNTTDTLNESDAYLSFSLSPNLGYQISITELSWTRLNASSTGPGTGRWGYSIGSGSFTLQDTFSVTTANSSGNWNSISITDATETIEFRFWAYGSVSAGGGSSGAAGSVNFRNTAGENLVLNGTVTAVPEPSTIAFLGFASLGLCFMLWRRRRA